MPLVPLFQVSNTLRLCVKHTFPEPGLEDRRSRAYFASLTNAILLGDPAPAPQLPTGLRPGRGALPYEDFAAGVRELTGGEGAHAVYDSVGAATFEESVRALRRRGTLVVCGLSSGPLPPVDVELLRTAGSLYLTRPTLADHVPDAASLRAAAAELGAHVADGVVRPGVGERLPLAEAARAHTLLESRATTGKVLLTP